MFKWYGQQAITDVKREMNKRLRRAGRFLKSEVQQNISVEGKGEPSLPGEFPKKQTGRLHDSVVDVYDNLKSEGYVGTNVTYGRVLEKGNTKVEARPWLGRTLKLVYYRIQSILRGGA